MASSIRGLDVPNAFPGAQIQTTVGESHQYVRLLPGSEMFSAEVNWGKHPCQHTQVAVREIGV